MRIYPFHLSPTTTESHWLKYVYLLLGLQLESNTVENIEAIYTTLALLITELGSEETVCDILQLILAWVYAMLRSYRVT